MRRANRWALAVDKAGYWLPASRVVYAVPAQRGVSGVLTWGLSDRQSWLEVWKGTTGAFQLAKGDRPGFNRKACGATSAAMAPDDQVAPELVNWREGLRRVDLGDQDPLRAGMESGLHGGKRRDGVISNNFAKTFGSGERRK